jgi:CheY-like chemotaxis protein
MAIRGRKLGDWTRLPSQAAIPQSPAGEQRIRATGEVSFTRARPYSWAAGQLAGKVVDLRKPAGSSSTQPPGNWIKPPGNPGLGAARPDLLDPRGRIPGSSVDRLQVEAKSTSAAAAGGNRRVLIVEDHADGRQSLRLLLELKGHEVAVAADGAEGVRVALEFRPEVALIDLGLPLLDGLEVCRRVRAALGGQVFLVALTARDDPDDIQQTAEAGFDFHLVKPADPEGVSRLVAWGGRGGWE